MKKQLKVLLIEDSKDDTLLIIDYLKQSDKEIKFERVETAKEMESALKKTSWDIIYSDYFLPDFNGLDALKLLKKNKVEIPFVVVSGKIGEEKAVEIIKAGADDYIMKDRLARLLPATEKLLQEFELRKQFSEEKYRVLVENANEAIVVAQNGMLKYVNPKAIDITGFSQEELLSKLFIELIHPEDQKMVAERYNKRLQGEELPSVYPFRILDKNGDTKWLEINAVLINWEEESATLNFLNDITKRRYAEEALKESEERFRKLVDTAQVCIAIHQEGIIVFANKQTYESLGYEKEAELLGKPALEVMHPDSRQVVANRIKKMMKTGHLVPPVEEKLLRKDGSVMFGLVSSIPITYKGNTAFQVTAVDITEQKKAQEKIKTSLKEKEILLKEIHHRVKNSLQVISSLLYLQSKDLKDEETVNIFVESQNRIRSMALVHEKLYRSKNLAQINLSTYIRDLANALFRTYLISVNKVKLVMDIQKTALDIDTAIQCGLILNELISNALKYAFPKDLSGEISIVLKSKQNRMVELLVSDTGVGLPDHFDITEKNSLGMRLVESLVDQIHGRMEIENNNGTAFKIWFKTKDFAEEK
ncbi:PAS domain S-box protein [candidate division KSB1 bacterium]|nr:PAS domain S-box protein [candidate division KSB1 bacterium]